MNATIVGRRLERSPRGTRGAHGQEFSGDATSKRANVSPTRIPNLAEHSMRRLQSAHATLQMEHDALQSAHASLTSELYELREAHAAQSQMLSAATTRADSAELAVVTAMQQCASLTAEVKEVRLAWVGSQETLHKACASRQEEFSNRIADVSRASRAALSGTPEPAAPTSPRTRTPPSPRKVSPNVSPPHMRTEASPHSSAPTSTTASPPTVPFYAHPRESVPALPPLPPPARGWSRGEYVHLPPTAGAPSALRLQSLRDFIKH